MSGVGDGGGVDELMVLPSVVDRQECKQTPKILGKAGRATGLPRRLGVGGPWQVVAYGEVGGQVSDIEIQAKDILDTRQILNEILADHTGQDIDTIARDTDRDFYMMAQQAKEYGLVDLVLERSEAKSKSETSTDSGSSSKPTD